MVQLSKINELMALRELILSRAKEMLLVKRHEQQVEISIAEGHIKGTDDFHIYVHFTSRYNGHMLSFDTRISLVELGLSDEDWAEYITTIRTEYETRKALRSTKDLEDEQLKLEKRLALVQKKLKRNREST